VKHARRLLRWLAIGMCCAASVLLLSYILILTDEVGDATLPADCAIIFGAAVVSGNLPGPALTRRVGKAAELYRAHQINRLILSGGKGDGNRQSEAAVMRRLAVSLGVSASHITLEQQSHSTWENLLYSRNLTEGCSSIVGISDGYHLARIKLLAFRQGWPRLATIPATTNGGQTKQEQKALTREFFAYMYYLLWMDHLLHLSSDTATDETLGMEPRSLLRLETAYTSIDLFV
jgi:uncharacterized SAM-binding protein YcdF (DUF218 family)